MEMIWCAMHEKRKNVCILHKMIILVRTVVASKKRYLSSLDKRW